MKEAFRTRIVVEVAFGAHAATLQAVGIQQHLIVLGTVLASPVTVHDDSLQLLASEQRHLQGIADQLRRHALGHRPADDST